MKTIMIKHSKVIKDYNRKYGTDFTYITCSSLELDSIICNLYDFDDYELDDSNLILFYN